MITGGALPQPGWRERERDSMLSFCIVKSFDNSNILQFKIKELK
jgi:hypothetical protein